MATATTATRRTAPTAAQVGRARTGVNQLREFQWVGIDKRGVKLKGIYEAKSDILVKAELRRQGINPTSVRLKAKPLFGQTGRRVKPRDIAVFSRQISVMIAAGVPMVQAFDIIAGGQTNPRMKNMLTDIKTNIEGGSALAESLGKYPVQFDELFCNLVKAGETAGVLDTVLDTIATYKENIEVLKGKIKKALFYPAMIFAVAILVSAILLIFVVPQFEAVFHNMGAQLPAFTQMILNASRFMVGHWLIMLIAVIGFIATLIFAYKRSARIRSFLRARRAQAARGRQDFAPVGYCAFFPHSRRHLQSRRSPGRGA